MKLVILAIMFFSNSVFANGTITTHAICFTDLKNLEVAIETEITSGQSYIVINKLDSVRPPIIINAQIAELPANIGFLAVSTEKDAWQVTVKAINTDTSQTTDKPVQFSTLTIPNLELVNEPITCNLDIPNKF